MSFMPLRPNALPFQLSSEHGHQLHGLGRRASQMNSRWPLVNVLRGWQPSAGSKRARCSTTAESDLLRLGTSSAGIAATLVCGLMFHAARRRATPNQSRIALQVTRRTGRKVESKKTITATTRLPLWQLTDEMYLERQIAPDPRLNWAQVKKASYRMKQQVREQQQRDFLNLEKEASGKRLPPTYAVSELRPGMWLEGRVSRSVVSGVMVDVGAYTERGEWIDGRLNKSHIREDGDYVAEEEVMNHVHLGEYVRVRVTEVSPATGRFRLSMMTVEDLPQLFLGKPRQYSVLDLDVGMKVPAIVRRAWDAYAIVDIGADRTAMLSVRDHFRTNNAWGFLNTNLSHTSAKTAYPKGAQFDVWIKKISEDGRHITVSCNEQRPEAVHRAVRGQVRPTEGVQSLDPGPAQERLTKQQQVDRQRSAKEKENWQPYVPYVDEWLEDASIADDETDSWVARVERDIFAEADDDKDNADKKTAGFLTAGEEEDEFGEDEFGEDEFADDDFADDNFAGNESTASDASEQELDGWEMDDDNVKGDLKATAASTTSEKGLSEADVEDFFYAGAKDTL